LALALHVEDFGKVSHFGHHEDARLLELLFEHPDVIRIADVEQGGGLAVLLKRLEDRVGVVEEVEDVGRALAGVRAVQA
jgi:hypothetical protein